MFPYGAQYYRSPNPPQVDWDDDFRTMREYGFTVVKVWAMWNWIHAAEDEFDFSHIDRLLELAERHGLKLIINTILENAPYWLINRSRDQFYEASDGQRFEPITRSNTPGGGWPGLCLDNAPARATAEKFLRAIGSRYVDHPALWGYDIWNEVFQEIHGYAGFEGRYFCYCDASKARFVEWLKARYGSIEELNRVWYRRYGDWSDVYPPRYLGGYPDWLDWLKFRVENQRDQMRWRVSVMRSVDSKHPLTSHGIAYTLHGLPTQLTNDFDIAPEVDQWGLSAFPMAANQHASDYFRMVDLVRSACQTTPRLLGPELESGPNRREFWQNELQGGQSVGGLGRSRVVTGRDIALWNWMSFMCGATGLMYWQWRPELLGQESPGYGLCRVDGTPTDRTDAAGWFAQFMNANPELSAAEPIRGDVAILFLPESELFTFVADGKTDAYADDAHGVYRALWNVNVQVDFCTIDRVGDYKLVLLPFPLMIEAEHARKLVEYVRNGGVLVSHTAPAQHIDHGYASFRVPGLGLDEMFGCEQDVLEYVPAMVQGDVDPPAIEWQSMRIPCAVYQEKLIPTGGTVFARYSDGTPAVVDHCFSRGKARLIGTCLGASHIRTLDHEPELLIRDGLRFAGIEPAILTLDTALKARLMRGEFAHYLWVLNTSYERLTSEVTLSFSLGSWTNASDLVTGESSLLTRNSLSVTLEPLTGTVYRLG